MATKNSPSKRKDYLRGFGIALMLLFIGTLLEWVTGGRGMALPSWPMNIFIGISFAFIIAFLHFLYNDIPFVKWLSRVPASISAIALFTFLTLILGLTKQNNPEASTFFRLSGFDHIQHSFTFLLSGLYLLLSLGLVILRRLKPLTYRNAGFLLNHMGLWIIVLAGSLGAGDLTRLNIYANENEPVWYGFNQNRQPQELPFTLNLLDFNIEFYNPKIAYIETKGMVIPEDIENNLTLIEKGENVEIANWDIHFEEFYPYAMKDSTDIFYPSEDTMAVPVAKIKAVNKLTRQTINAYLSYGGLMTRPIMINLNERYSLAMTKPEPKEYSSLIQVMKANGEIDTTKIVVNKPLKLKGWNLYQQSYDERLGKWSRLSVIEAIKDPWLPVIYVGIFMVIAGAIYLFSIGKNPKED